ncbi:MAG: DNA repair protein RecO [Gemmatimonadota bacterium]
MPLVRTPALVLRAYDYGDSSRIFRLTTPESGVQSLLARGVKGPRSRLRGVLDLFNLIEVSYVRKPGRTLHLPRDADLVSTHPRMKRDLDRTLAFGSVARLLQALSEEGERNPELFGFMVATASAFDAPELPSQALEPLRQHACWQVLSFKGYAPQVEHCVACGAAAGRRPSFAVSEGGVLCGRCAAGRPSLSTREYGALRLFVDGEASAAAEWRFAEGEGRRLDRIREAFAAYHTGFAPARPR